LTTVRQQSANRANATASTGPRTKAGKARSARNALRHGLNIAVWSEPALAPEAEAIARRIAGPEVGANALEWARRIGEAQVDLNRVRSLRKQAIERRLSNLAAGLRLEAWSWFASWASISIDRFIRTPRRRKPGLRRFSPAWRTNWRGSTGMNGARSRSAKRPFAVTMRSVRRPTFGPRTPDRDCRNSLSRGWRRTSAGMIDRIVRC
jgi:hypothetical protein